MAEVENNRAEGRYELRTDGETAISAYHVEGDAVVFTHTVVPQALEGRGVGSTLVAGALDDVRAQGLRVVPQCAFVAAYIERHPTYADLIAA